MYLLFDIGATNMRFAVTDKSNSLETPRIVSTIENFDTAIQTIQEIAKELLHGRVLEGVVGGVRALNKEKTSLETHPTIHLWEEKPLQVSLQKALGVSVVLENDATMAAVGEAVFGAGKDHNVFAYVTVSTGVGSTLVVNKVVAQQDFKLRLVQVKGKSLEEQVSGSGIEQQYGKKPKEIVDNAVWEELATKLAFGLDALVKEWKPEVIVLGGAMILGNPAISLKKTQEYMKEQVPLVQAKLGDLSGLYGALAICARPGLAQ
jgi:predicted NBD/HSP70 family sugar kinase